MNLLILNDEKLTVEMMKNGINWKDYGIDEVFTAYETEEGKLRVNENKIDIVLCDIEMPGENGIEFMRWVRKEKKEIECIFLTCHASFEYAMEAISLGCQNYILMPAKFEDVGEAVLKVVKMIHEKEDVKLYQEMGKQAVLKKVENALENYGEKMKPEEIVEYIVNYVKDHLTEEELTVNEIGKNLFLHPVYLNRLFKKEKEISIGQYIINERLNLAAAMLIEGKLSVNAIAEQTGYRSCSNFNLAFKKRFGCAPSQYQKIKKGLLL